MLWCCGTANRLVTTCEATSAAPHLSLSRQRCFLATRKLQSNSINADSADRDRHSLRTSFPYHLPQASVIHTWCCIHPCTFEARMRNELYHREDLNSAARLGEPQVDSLSSTVPNNGWSGQPGAPYSMAARAQLHVPADSSLPVSTTNTSTLRLFTIPS